MGSNKVEVDENDSNKHNLGTTHNIVSRVTNPKFIVNVFFCQKQFVSCSLDPTTNSETENRIFTR